MGPFTIETNPKQRRCNWQRQRRVAGREPHRSEVTGCGACPTQPLARPGRSRAFVRPFRSAIWRILGQRGLRRIGIVPPRFNASLADEGEDDAGTQCEQGEEDQKEVGQLEVLHSKTSGNTRDWHGFPYTCVNAPS